MKVFIVVLVALVCFSSALISKDGLKINPPNPYHSQTHKLKELKKGLDIVKEKAPLILQSVSEPSSVNKRQPSACISSIVDMVLYLNSTSCRQLQNFFENIGTINEANAISLLTQQCASGGCVTELSTKLIKVRNDCPSDVFDNENDVRNALAFFQLPCIKEGNDFCFVKFAALVTLDDGNDDNDDTPPTKEQLDTLCHPCIKRVLFFLSQFQTEDEDWDLSFLDIVCIRDDNQYCFITLPAKFKQIEQDFPNEDDPNRIGAFLEILCENRCFAKISAIARDFAGEEFWTNFNGLCLKKGNDYCLSEAFKVQSKIETIETNCNDFDTCGGECKAAGSDLVNTLGCCFNLFIELVKQDNETNNEEIDAFIQFFRGKCGIQIPSLCPFPSIIKASFTIKNLKFSFVQNNRDLVERYIKLDVSANTGVKFDNIEVTELTQIGDDVLVEVTLRPDNFAEEIATDLQNESEDFQFENLASLPADSKVDPLSPFTMNGVETQVQSTTSSGSTLTLSIFSLIVVLFVSFF